MGGSLYTFRQWVTPPATQDPNALLPSSSPEGSNVYHDRFDMAHLLERRHSIGTLTYSQSMSINGAIGSSPANMTFRSRSNSTMETTVGPPNNTSEMEDSRPQKDPMTHMMLKGQLLDF
jgi:hypothetical protein